MHIVQIYHSKVPIKLYGGMERVIENLCKGFVTLGHKVTLISYRGDYDLPGVNLIDLDRFSSMENAMNRYTELIPSDADVLHYHVPFNFPKLDLPNVMTLHGNLKEEEDPATLPEHTVFISQKHAINHKRQTAQFIYHGLDLETVPFNEKALNDRKYFAFLGRASLKRKGLKDARKLAKDLKRPLLVGGGNGLSWGNTKYLGHLNNEQKYNLLGKAKALLFPISWEEPFGLVMIEAMFCGTPVWAYCKGSVPEVLGQPGSEGLFVVANDYESLLHDGKNYNFSVEPSVIRNYAEKYFSHLTMCQAYIDYYKSIK